MSQLVILEKILKVFEKKTNSIIRRKYWIDELHFLDLIEKIKDYSLMTDDKLYTIFSYCRHSLQLTGNIIEIGVYKGGSSKIIAQLAKEKGKSVFLFDTFEGFENINKMDFDPGRNSEYKNVVDTSMEEVKNFLSDYENVHIVKGIFPNSAVNFIEKYDQFCFAHIDVDVYQSMLESLKTIYEKMVKSGVIVIDDYGSKKWLGVKKAVDEFLMDKPENPICTTTNQCIIIKI